MPRLKRQTYYVICAGPDPRADPGLRWMSRSGAVSTLRANAARFVTVTDAHHFAQMHGIALDGVTRYIAREEFVVIALRAFPT
jgi:hypothetical protein